MPFKSQAQRAKFYILKSQGKMDQKTIDEWDSHTPKDIPAKVSENPFTKAFEDAAAHNSQNEQKQTFHITYKKMNGRTVKRKVDPGTIRNGLMIAYDHKRKAIRSFKLDKVKDMKKVASFLEGFCKKAGLADHLTHGAEIAGLGILAAPSVKAMVTGKNMSDKNTHRAEIAGLGVLAAPSIAHFAKGFMKKAFLDPYTMAAVTAPKTTEEKTKNLKVAVGLGAVGAGAIAAKKYNLVNKAKGLLK